MFESGSKKIVYVPVVPKFIELIDPLLPKRPEVRVVELGFSIDTVIQQLVRVPERFRFRT